MDPIFEHKLLATRRHLLGSMAGGIGALAMQDLLGAGVATPAVATDPMAAKQPPLPAKAKRMIVIHLTGSPPHLDLYDHKPELVKHSGEDCPAEAIAGKKFAFTSGTPKLLGRLADQSLRPVPSRIHTVSRYEGLVLSALGSDVAQFLLNPENVQEMLLGSFDC